MSEELNIKAKIVPFSELDTDENLIYNFEECLETEFTGDIDDVCMRLSILEAYTDEFSKEEIYENRNKFISFYEYFCDNFEEINDMLDESENYPFVLYLGEYYLEEEEMETVREEFETLPDKVKKNAETLIEYIWNIRERRWISLCTDDSLQTLDLYKNIRKDEINSRKESLNHLIKKAVLSDSAGLMFRYVKDKKKKETYINGFKFEDGNIEKLEINDLIDAMELQPDGSREPIKKTDFPQIATCKLTY